MIIRLVGKLLSICATNWELRFLCDFGVVVTVCVWQLWLCDSLIFAKPIRFERAHSKFLEVYLISMFSVSPTAMNIWCR